MDISVQSSDLISSLADRIAQLTVELETTKLALTTAQEALEEQFNLNLAMRSELAEAGAVPAAEPVAEPTQD